MAYEVYFKCDRCGHNTLIPLVLDYEDAATVAEKLGWDVFTKKEDGTYDDLCPECKKKECNNVE